MLQRCILHSLAGPTNHRKGKTKDLINTAKYDKGPDNPKPNSNLKSFVVLCYGMTPSPLSFSAVFSKSI